MKLVLETTGDFQIYGMAPEQFAHHDRPSVVTQSSLMQQRLAAGQLRLLGSVNDSATDEDLVKTIDGAGGDHELAVASFLEEFPLEGEAKPKKPAKPVAEPTK